MSTLVSYKCNECNFYIPSTFAGHLYVRENGHMVVSHMPGGEHKLSQLLHVSDDDAFAWLQQKYTQMSPGSWEKFDGNVGMSYLFVCSICFKLTWLNPHKEDKQCSKCFLSGYVTYVDELTEYPCPKCNLGTIERTIKDINWTNA